MTGFALGDKFIGVSTDNIYTKQELDTKLQDKQDTLIAGQGIDISEDGTISANTNLDVSNPLELAYPQLPNHGISLNDDGTFRRIAGATNQYSIPSVGTSFLTIRFAASNLSGQTGNTIPINNYDAAYADWEASATIVHEMLLINEGGSNPRECFVFGNLEDDTFTMKAYIGLNESGQSVMAVGAYTFTGGSWSSKSFTPSDMKSGGSGTVSYGVRGDDDYCKFGLNEGGNYALTFYDKATNTLKAHVEFTKGDFKTVVQSCNCVLLPFGYVDYESNASLHYDPEYNKVLSSTGTELWTATIPNTSVTPTLQLNYDSTLTLNGDNLGVNTSNLGLATVATTGSYTDLTNTPEEYVLPTASTDTLGGVKVDGTSIVIADGVISTNTGTGVDTYTKVEVNNLLSAKQDTITPSSPLSITKEVRSNLEGFQYTTDSTGVYTTGNYYWSSWVAPYQFIKANGDLPGATLNPQTFTNKIVIPYTFGQVVKLPTDSTLGTPNGGYSPFCFGKILNDGTFIPIYQPILNSRYIIMSDTPTTYGGTNNKLIQMPTTDNGKQSPDTSEQLASDADNLTYVLIQMLLDDTDSNLSTNVMNYSPYSTSQGHPGKGQYNFTQANYINRLKEINCIIICPTPGYGINTDTAISVSSIGLYANPGNLYNLITSENYNNIDLGENLFYLSVEQAYNYLDLNIDNNTLKINESNQLFANIPENLTTQGNEFNGANQLVQLDTSGKLPAIDGSQLTNLPGNTGYTKSEVDTFLADKQDKLTAVTPITINTYVKSPLNGMTYTGDGQSIYQNVTSEVSYIEKASDNFTLYPSSIQSSSIDDFFKSFVDIPFIEGSVYTLGQQKRSDGYTATAPWVIGKTLPSGTFIPIFWSNSGGGAKLNLSDTIIAEQNKITFTNVASIGNLNVNAGQSSDTGISHGWLQITSPEETTLKIKVSIPSSNRAQSTVTLTITDTAQVARLRECNTVRLVPIGSANWYAWATSINSAVAISKIGRYQYSGEAPYNLAQENLGENLFKIDVETAQTYLELNFDSKTLKIDDENNQLSVNTDSFATQDDLANKLDITKCTDIPVGLEHSISDGVLSVQTGYVKSAKGQLEVTEPLTTADISNVQTGVDNRAILGDVTTQRTLEINENTGKYLFFAGTDANQQNNMVEDNRGSWIFASSSQGKNSTTCPYYGFIFNEEQPAGNYSVTINIISGWINICLAKGTIGNLTNLITDESSAGIKTFDFEVSEPFSTIYVYYGNYYNFQVAYDCKITQTVSATEFSTYLCVKDGTQSIKLLNDTTELASYTDYAKIGKVIYDVTLANPTAFPSQDLANKYLSGGLEVPSLNNVITNKTLKNYIKQGDNVTITPESDGSLTISSTGGTVGDNVITSDNISQNEYIKQLEARIAALETALDGGNSLGEIITNTVIQTAGTPAGGQNSGYVGTQTITVQDLETS